MTAGSMVANDYLMLNSACYYCDFPFPVSKGNFSEGSGGVPAQIQLAIKFLFARPRFLILVF